jgi:hypothetical protein
MAEIITIGNGQFILETIPIGTGSKFKILDNTYTLIKEYDVVNILLSHVDLFVTDGPLMTQLRKVSIGGRKNDKDWMGVFYHRNLTFNCVDTKIYISTNLINGTYAQTAVGPDVDKIVSAINMGMMEFDQQPDGTLQFVQYISPPDNTIVATTVVNDSVHAITDKGVIYMYESGPNKWNHVINLTNVPGEITDFQMNDHMIVVAFAENRSIVRYKIQTRDEASFNIEYPSNVAITDMNAIFCFSWSQMGKRSCELKFDASEFATNESNVTEYKNGFLYEITSNAIIKKSDIHDTGTELDLPTISQYSYGNIYLLDVGNDNHLTILQFTKQHRYPIHLVSTDSTWSIPDKYWNISTDRKLMDLPESQNEWKQCIVMNHYNFFPSTHNYFTYIDGGYTTVNSVKSGEQMMCWVCAIP